MGRLIGSVVIGYLVMAAFVFVTFTILWMILGTDGAYKPGSWEISGTWLVFSIVLTILSAVLGGMACAALAKKASGPQILAAVVVILGLVMAIPVLTQSDETPEPRPVEVSMTEAMQNARQPTWIALLNPVLGAVGVLIGAGMLSSKPKADA
jgi:hypothetical protein